MNENIKKAIHDIIEKLQAERDANQSSMRARDVYLSENAKGFDRGLAYTLFLLLNDLKFL